MILTGTTGRKVIVAPATTLVKPGETYQFPPAGSPAIKIKPALGKEQITVFASEEEFPGGLLLRGKDLADRVVHPFYKMERDARGQLRLRFDASRMVKKTIEIETR